MTRCIARHSMQRLQRGKVGGVVIPLLAAKYVHQEQTVSMRLHWSCLGAMCCGARVTGRKKVGGVELLKPINDMILKGILLLAARPNPKRWFRFHLRSSVDPKCRKESGPCQPEHHANEMKPVE